MTVFKTYLKILNKNKFTIILYTIILLVFGVSNMSNTESTLNFSANKPKVLIVNEDESKFSKNLVEYMNDNCELVENKDNLSIDDALFYREINYVIYIDKNYGNDFLNGKNPTIEVKESGDYNSSLASMMLKRYIKVANIYSEYEYSEDELIDKINNTLDKNTEVEVMSKLDTSSLDRTAYYFNFASYSLLACLIYVICLIISIFNNDKIRKRTIISSMNYKKHNKLLLLSNLIYSFAIWLFYVAVGYFILGNVLFSSHGLIFILNSLVFTISATALAFLIGNLTNKKEAISGIMNVVSLGSSFLCGAFVPQEMLPSVVLKLAHLFPTYYYICANEKLKTIQTININTLKPILINLLIIIIFTMVFLIINNYISSKKRKIG